MLRHGTIGTTRTTWFWGGPGRYVIAWPGPACDNRGVRAGGPAVIAAVLFRAGGELGRWLL